MTSVALAALFCAACAAAPSEEMAMTPASGSCNLVAADSGELPPDAICALFAPVMAAHADARLEIAMPTNYRATVRMVAADGAVLAQASGSVSDRAYYAGAWERLASALARQLAEGGAR